MCLGVTNLLICIFKFILALFEVFLFIIILTFTLVFIGYGPAFSFIDMVGTLTHSIQPTHLSIYPSILDELVVVFVAGTTWHRGRLYRFLWPPIPKLTQNPDKGYLWMRYGYLHGSDPLQSVPSPHYQSPYTY